MLPSIHRLRCRRRPSSTTISGPKEDLFGAAVAFPLRPRQAAEMILAGGVDHLGENLTPLFFSVWEAPESREAQLAMLRGAFTTEQGARTLWEFFGSIMLDRVAGQSTDPMPNSGSPWPPPIWWEWRCCVMWSASRPSGKHPSMNWSS